MTPRYRASLIDGDTSRERPLTIYGESLSEIERWAGQVLPGALEGGRVDVFEVREVIVKSIPKEPKA